VPDIVLPNVFVSGNTTNGDAVTQNLYDPAATPNSFEVLDGWLGNPNRQPGWDIRAQQIMKRRMVEGWMVGSTGPIDYFSNTFPTSNTDTGAYRRIPGCGISWFSYRAYSAVVLTWQIITATAEDTLADNIELRFRVDDVVIPRQFRVQPFTQSLGLRSRFRDRIWSGHWCSLEAGAPSVGIGWHNAWVEMFHGDAAGAGANTTRVRTRNMKVFRLR